MDFKLLEVEFLILGSKIVLYGSNFNFDIGKWNSLGEILEEGVVYLR